MDRRYFPMLYPPDEEQSMAVEGEPGISRESSLIGYPRGSM